MLTKFVERYYLRSAHFLLDKGQGDILKTLGTESNRTLNLVLHNL